MKIQLEFSPTSAGMLATIKTTEGEEGEKSATEMLSMEMPEPTGDERSDRAARLATARDFFQRIGDKVWGDMSPDDFKQ